MEEKITIITGATSGIGYETAKKLYLAGHHLVLGNRNHEKAKKLKKELLNLNKDGKVDMLHIDLSSFSSIKAFANEVINNYDKIDVLINNAGVFMREEAYTEENFEMTMGVNHLGTYLLTELLLDKLKENDKAKIIMLSSVGCYWGSLRMRPDIFTRRTNSFKDYFNSKLANLFYAIELNKRLEESNVIIKAADPGIAYSHIWKWKSKFGQSLDKIYKKITSTSEEGSRIVVLLADSNKYDSDSSLLYKYDKSRKLPRRTRREKRRKEFIEFTENTMKKYL